MIYERGYDPKVQLTKTIAHPDQPDLVIGFEGRDTVYGVDAVVLKVDEIPVAGTHMGGDTAVGIPPRAAMMMETEDRSLYLLGPDDETVWAAGGEVIFGAIGCVFDADGYSQQEFPSLQLSAFAEFDRDDVEVNLS